MCVEISNVRAAKLRLSGYSASEKLSSGESAARGRDCVLRPPAAGDAARGGAVVVSTPHTANNGHRSRGRADRRR